MAFTNPIGQVELAAGSQVGLAPGAAVDVNGSTLAAGTPVTGPSAATRNVSASASASAIQSLASIGTQNTTLIAAPGAGNSLELHTLVMSVTLTSVTGAAVGTASATARIIDTTTLQVIAQCQATITSNGTNNAQDAISLDLQGVTLPANHGVTFQLQTTAPGTDVPTAIALINALTFTTVS